MDLFGEGLEGAGHAWASLRPPAAHDDDHVFIVAELGDVAAPALLAFLVRADHLVALGAILQAGESTPAAEKESDGGESEDQNGDTGGAGDESGPQTGDEG